MLIYHLNSGYGHFRGIQSQSSKEDIGKIIAEIENEAMNGKEQKERFDEFMTVTLRQYGSDDLTSCGTCGLQELQRGPVKYHSLELDSAPSCFQLDDRESQEMLSRMGNGNEDESWCVQVPVNGDGTESKWIDLWRAASVYIFKKDGRNVSPPSRAC